MEGGGAIGSGGRVLGPARALARKLSSAEPGSSTMADMIARHRASSSRAAGAALGRLAPSRSRLSSPWQNQATRSSPAAPAALFIVCTWRNARSTVALTSLVSVSTSSSRAIRSRISAKYSGAALDAPALIKSMGGTGHEST